MLNGKEEKLSWYVKELNVVKQKYENMLLEKTLLEEQEEKVNIGILKEIELRARKTTQKCSSLLMSTEALKSDQEKLRALTYSMVADISKEVQNVREYATDIINSLDVKAKKIRYNNATKEMILITRWKEDLNRVLQTVEELKINQVTKYKEHNSHVSLELRKKIQHLIQIVKNVLSISITKTTIEQKEYIANERGKWEQEVRGRKNMHGEQMLLCSNAIERVKALMDDIHRDKLETIQRTVQEKKTLFRDEMTIIKNSSEEIVYKVQEDLKTELSKAKDEIKEYLDTQSLVRKEEINSISIRYNEKYRRRWDKWKAKLKLKIQQEIRKEKKSWLELKLTLQKRIYASITAVDKEKEKLLAMQEKSLQKRRQYRMKVSYLQTRSCTLYRYRQS